MLKTIRFRLFLAFFLAFLVVLVILSAVLLYGFPGHAEYGVLPWEKRQASARLMVAADLTEARLVRWLEERRDDVRAIAQLDSVLSDVTALQQAPAHAEGYQHRLSDTLRTIQRSHGVYDILSIIDANTNRILACSDSQFLNQRYPLDATMQAVITGDRDIIGGISLSPLLHRPMLHMMAPILEPNGRVSAVVLIGSDPDHLIDTVLSTDRELGGTAEAILTDSSGVILHRLKYKLPNGQVPQPLQYRVTARQTQLALAGREGEVESTDYRGVPVLMAYRNVPVSPHVSWALLVKQDRAELFAPVRNRLLVILGLSLLGLLIFGLLAGVTARRMSAPLVALTRTAQKVSAGDLSARSSVATQDEIGSLAGAFNSLVTRVAERTADLEARNTQLGAEIEERTRAEESLRQEKSFSEMAINSLPGVFYLFGQQGTFLRWNRNFETVTGYTSEEFAALRPVDLFEGEDRERVAEAIGRVFATGEAMVEADLISKEGRRIPYYFVGFRMEVDGTSYLIGSGLDITERKQAEEALRRQAGLIELSPDGTLVWRPDATITFWSRGAEAMYGWTRIEAMGRNSHELLHTKFPEPLIDMEAQIQNTGYWSGELQHYTKDGREMTVQSWWLAQFDAQGRLYEILETSVDITERKRAAQILEQQVAERTRELALANQALQEEVAERARIGQELQAASLYSRSLIEASLDPLVTISPEGKITDVNQATITVTGVPRDELVGTDFSNYFTEPDLARAGYQRVLSQGFVTDYALTIRHRDGRLTHVLYNATLYRDADDNVQGVFAAARDVTVQRQAAQYARSLIEASLDPLVTISPEGKITDVNQATIEVTGVPRIVLIGTDFSSYFTEPEQARAGYQRVFSEGFVTDYPLTVRHRDGHLTDVLYNATVYRDVDGKVLGVSAAARDVTERKRAEEEIRRLNAELEERVRQRTAQLQAALHEMEAFTYTVSHDLRAPLRAMDGFSLALLEDYREKLEEEGINYLMRIRTGSQRMGQLIDDLLALSRVTRGEMQQRPVNLSALARTITTELQESEPTRDVTFIIADDVTTHGDPRLIEQVLRNLLGNAWKFTAKHPTARIEFGVTEVEGERAFFVRDDGAGFDMKYATKLFGVFQRLHGTDEFEGTGIGLATVQRIITRHNGRVWAEGARERGATFYFTLPS